jgi:hypothetical protein
MPWAKHLKKVFYVELLINLISIIQIFFMNGEFLRGFGAAPATGLGESFLWFGTLLIVITYIMARALFTHDDRALRYILEGYLIGDFVYIGAEIAFINAIGGLWTPMAIAGLVITLILITARILYLWETRKPANS